MIFISLKCRILIQLSTLHLYFLVFSVDAEDCFNIRVRNGLLFCYNCKTRLGHFGKALNFKHYLEIDNVRPKEFFPKSVDFQGGKTRMITSSREIELEEFNDISPSIDESNNIPLDLSSRNIEPEREEEIIQLDRDIQDYSEAELKRFFDNCTPSFYGLIDSVSLPDPYGRQQTPSELFGYDSESDQLPELGFRGFDPSCESEAIAVLFNLFSVTIGRQPEDVPENNGMMNFVKQEIDEDADTDMCSDSDADSEPDYSDWMGPYSVYSDSTDVDVAEERPIGVVEPAIGADFTRNTVSAPASFAAFNVPAFRADSPPPFDELSNVNEFINDDLNNNAHEEFIIPSSFIQSIVEDLNYSSYFDV